MKKTSPDCRAAFVNIAKAIVNERLLPTLIAYEFFHHVQSR